VNASPVPCVTLTKARAAQALDMSVDSFERHVLPEVKVIRRGRLTLVSLVELQRWAERESAVT
jgi:hypothetical protein